MAFRKARGYEVDAEDGGYSSGDADGTLQAATSDSTDQCCYEYKQRDVNIKLSKSSEYLEAVVFEDKNLQTSQTHQLVQGFMVSNIQSTSGTVYAYSIVKRLRKSSLKMKALTLWQVRNDDHDKQFECMQPLQKWAVDNGFFFIDYT